MISMVGLLNDLIERGGEETPDYDPSPALTKLIAYYQKEGFIFGFMKCPQCEGIWPTLEDRCQVENPMTGKMERSGPFNPCPRCVDQFCHWFIITRTMKDGEENP